MKKKTIIITIVIGVIICILGASAITFSTLWQNAENSLEAANQALLNEANYSQSLKHEIQRLQKELEVEEKSYMKLGRDLEKTQEELATAQEELAQSTVIGQVYADTNYNQALDWRDQKVAGEISGFEIVLYTTERKSDGSLSSVEIASTAIANGEYRFLVNPGEYFVGVNYSDNQLYNRRYNHIVYISSGGNIIIGTGETVVGPTILLSHDGGKG